MEKTKRQRPVDSCFLQERTENGLKISNWREVKCGGANRSKVRRDGAIYVGKRRKGKYRAHSASDQVSVHIWGLKAVAYILRVCVEWSNTGT